MSARPSIPGRVFSFLRTILRNRIGAVDLPRFLTYTVTYTCNARCIMCDSWKIESPNDLTLDEVSAIFDQLPAMDAVRLTGGEPFVRRDLPEIVELARTKLHPLALHITSNGFLTDRIVSFLEARDKRLPLDLLISVDGLADKHNHVRGREHAWANVDRTLREIAPRRKALNVHLAVNQTIVDAEGVEHYRKLHEYLRPLGVLNHVVMAYDTSATYNLERELDVAPTEVGSFSTFGEFTTDHLAQLVREAEADLAEYPLHERLARKYYLRGIANRLLGETGRPNPRCVALQSHLRIFPNGDVPTCQFNSKTIGNLRDQSFAEIWASARKAEQRDWVKACPGCWAECEVLPSAIYSADLLRESLLPTRVGRTRRAGEPLTTTIEADHCIGANMSCTENHEATSTLVSLE